MKRSILSEAIRFKKTAISSGLVMVGLASLISIALFVASGDDDGGGGGGPPTPGGSIDLASADGLVAGLETAATFFGIVALALFALSVARDYEQGTIRMLAAAEPRRALLLGGKLGTLTLIVVAAVIIASAVSIGLSFALAPLQEVDTSLWTTSDGVEAALAATFSVATASIVWGVFGATLAIITRSAAVSITAGIGYLLIGENLLGIAWDQIGKWSPAAMLDAFTAGGTELVTYTKALVMLAVYVAAALIATFVVFERRDITD